MNPHHITVVENLLDNNGFCKSLTRISSVLGGADEAVIVKKIFDWCSYNKRKKSKQHFKDGWYWTYNSYESWQKELDWISPRTLRRLFKKLEALEVICSEKHKSYMNNHTKWYRINPEGFCKLLKNTNQQSTETDSNIDESEIQSGQFGHIDQAILDTRSGQNGQSEQSGVAKLATSETGQIGRISNNKLDNRENETQQSESASSSVGTPLSATSDPPVERRSKRNNHSPGDRYSIEYANAILPAWYIHPRFWELRDSGYDAQLKYTDSGIQFFDQPRGIWSTIRVSKPHQALPKMEQVSKLETYEPALLFNRDNEVFKCFIRGVFPGDDRLMVGVNANNKLLQVDYRWISPIHYETPLWEKIFMDVA